MSFRVRIKALKSGSSASVEIDDVIDGYGSSSAKLIRNSLSATKDAKKLNVYINSAGGEVTEGLAIYNMLSWVMPLVRLWRLAELLRRWRAIDCHGWRRNHHAEKLLDDDSQSVGGGCCGESEDMRSTADLLDKFRDQLAGIYSQREQGRRLADVLAAMAAETWMTGDEALALGYCSSVIEPVPRLRRASMRGVSTMRPKHCSGQNQKDRSKWTLNYWPRWGCPKTQPSRMRSRQSTC
jgi:ATP-dependent protease ClpP protease subunit